MAPEGLRNSALPRAFSDVVADLADLLQKELRLARAELSDKLATKLRAGMWLSGAAVLGFITAILLAQALVVWISSLGFSLHSSCLIVAAATAAGAVLAYFMGRADAREELTPERTLRQFNQDIQKTKEQLS